MSAPTCVDSAPVRRDDRYVVVGNPAVMDPGPAGNTGFLASQTMGAYPEPRRGGHDADVRRLRDLLRATVLRGGWPGGALPGEADLMTTHRMRRATVRAALALLRAEGLIERVQGVGTHAVARTVFAQLAEAHGTTQPSRDSIFNQRMRPVVTDLTRIPLPAVAADRLDAEPGIACLRLEYVSLLAEEPAALATNYVLFPEADRLADAPFVSDWYALLAEAGITIGESEFTLGSISADAATAGPLRVAPGTPLLAMEQLIRDPAGRPFDLAYVYTRGDRVQFVSRQWRAAPA